MYTKIVTGRHTRDKLISFLLKYYSTAPGTFFFFLFLIFVGSNEMSFVFFLNKVENSNVVYKEISVKENSILN